jgi:hypothetical protein
VIFFLLPILLFWIALECTAARRAHLHEPERRSNSWATLLALVSGLAVLAVPLWVWIQVGLLPAEPRLASQWVFLGPFSGPVSEWRWVMTITLAGLAAILARGAMAYWVKAPVGRMAVIFEIASWAGLFVSVGGIGFLFYELRGVHM